VNTTICRYSVRSNGVKTPLRERGYLGCLQDMETKRGGYSC